MSSFKIKDYLSQNKFSFKEIGRNELQMGCPICGRENHFYFNSEKGTGICHKCKWSTSIVGLLMVMGKLQKKDAVRLVFGLSDHSLSGISGRLEKLKGSEISEDYNFYVTFFRNEIPDGCIDVNAKNFPKALSERKITSGMAIKLEAKICNKSGKYFNRIIFPVSTLKTRTFIAQTGFTKDKFKEMKLFSKDKKNKELRKVLFPVGSFMSETLYLYDDFRDSEKDLFIVEGHLDAISMVRRGFNSNALFGKSISLEQAYLLSKTKANKIFYVPDGDVCHKDSVRYVSILDKICFDKEIRVCVLPFENDPDDIDDDSLFNSISKSLPLDLYKLLGVHL